ncbi:MAG TPA: D-tyrosyl-tRNA(Tyr) deacylase [Saprospiraceae bacterium]|nr:D-tyrosyl-tRNA(Tyr) deacylase [Saprospiraceae bacterium]
MRALIQRVSQASVRINGTITDKIGLGLLIFVGIENVDTSSDLEWLVRKIINMRIFSDEEGKMNLSVKDVSGQILVISQFTLHASTKKGNRPSFIKAARPDVAIPLYEGFIHYLSQEVDYVGSGQFGADMKVSLVNDGPVTILLDSQNKE